MTIVSKSWLVGYRLARRNAWLLGAFLIFAQSGTPTAAGTIAIDRNGVGGGTSNTVFVDDTEGANIPWTEPGFFKICKNQTYALCEVAQCFVLNGLAYCKCDVMSGDSISLPFSYDSQNICSINAAGVGNGYMASTFSSSPSLEPPNGDKAVYDCPGSTSDGAYAQCDGGLCFTSTEGKSFPGFEGALKQNEIICSCPITQPTPPKPVGFQIAGPYPCQETFFRYCKSATANMKPGSTINVGAPTGTAALLSKLLYGKVPIIHHCTM